MWIACICTNEMYMYELRMHLQLEKYTIHSETQETAKKTRLTQVKNILATANNKYHIQENNYESNYQGPHPSQEHDYDSQ